MTVVQTPVSRWQQSKDFLRTSKTRLAQCNSAISLLQLPEDLLRSSACLKKMKQQRRKSWDSGFNETKYFRLQRYDTVWLIYELERWRLSAYIYTLCQTDIELLLKPNIELQSPSPNFQLLTLELGLGLNNEGYLWSPHCDKGSIPRAIISYMVIPKSCL